MLDKTLFGKLPGGRDVFLYSLKNKSGTQINIINYGAIITNIILKDKKGRLSDVVLGYDSLEGYLNDKSFLGAIVGRYGNRIKNGKFWLNGTTYQLACNNGNNHLHGGMVGFSKVLWTAEPIVNKSGSLLKLTYVSPDGEEGYPGTVTLTVFYSLTEDNGLLINFQGITDKPTILNPTQHSYFNLSGDFTKSILEHELRIESNKFTPTDEEQITTGDIIEVAGTPMDFRKLTTIGRNINANYQQLKYGNGYDHNWILKNHNSTIRKAASVFEPGMGRLLEVYTDQPGLQFYSGNSLNGSIKGKNGISYEPRTGFCLETQHYPDSPNKPSFPSPILKPGETYRHNTIYKFSTK